MSFGFTLKYEGIEQLTDDLKDIEAGFAKGKLIQRAFEDGGKRALRDAQDLAPKDTGKLIQSLQMSVSDVRNVSAGRFGVAIYSPLLYAIVMELGSKKRWWPPLRALRGWAARHGFPPKSGAFLVARAIATKGILSPRGNKGYFYMQEALKRNELRISTMVLRAIDEFLAR